MALTVDIILTAQAAAGVNFAGHLAIVIDVFRATTSILTALERGAARVYPVGEIEQARALHETMPGSILSGERGGYMIKGFSYGNSPVAFSQACLAGLTLILTTTNGTLAIKNASGAEEVIIACLRNATRAAQEAAGRELPVFLVCAGTEGFFSIEDFYAAGIMAATLAERGFELSDLAWNAALLSRVDPAEVVNRKTCKHLRSLVQKGFGADIAYCLKRDVSAYIPLYFNHDENVGLKRP